MQNFDLYQLKFLKKSLKSLKFRVTKIILPILILKFYGLFTQKSRLRLKKNKERRDLKMKLTARKLHFRRVFLKINLLIIT